MWGSILAIFFGARLGALLRAFFNSQAANVVSIILLGTLLSNMVSGLSRPVSHWLF